MYMYYVLPNKRQEGASLFATYTYMHACIKSHSVRLSPCVCLGLHQKKNGLQVARASHDFYVSMERRREGDGASKGERGGGGKREKEGVRV